MDKCRLMYIIFTIKINHQIIIFYFPKITSKGDNRFLNNVHQSDKKY